jgi:TatA/E family protein of Tat protein translocase
MFGPLGFQEILLILVLALLIFGPKRLPEIGRTIGRSLGEFRRATSDIKRTIQLELDAAEEAPKIAPPEKAGLSARPSVESRPSATPPAEAVKAVEAVEASSPAATETPSRLN